MKCPYCNTDETSVIDSREAEDQTTIRRRRNCGKCGKRFTTYERVEGIDLKVLKKDGTRENFSREKLKRGLTKATWKRPISMSSIDELIDEVECRLRQRKSSEVKSWEIGNLVINRLKKVDKLSYLLFASVYRDFDSIEDFQTELQKLQDMQDPQDSCCEIPEAKEGHEYKRESTQENEYEDEEVKAK